VLYSTNAHWIFYLPAIAAWIVALVLAAAAVVVPPMALVGLPAAAVIAVVALYFTIRGWFHRFTTETDVTDRRVVHKTGFINRRTFEISLDKIASVEVIQSIPGRLLNYGDVIIVGMGEVPPQPIKTIASPLAFRSAITAH
jgi:uncharacterized membrane protein YdbT with pleckstrin-like domain